MPINWYFDDWFTRFHGKCYDNVFHKNCKSIKDKLEKENIKKVSVCRHHVFDVNMYLVSENGCSTCSRDIADALNIPRNWVELYKYGDDNTSSYGILEDKLNDKYCNSDGVLVFDEPFDLLKTLNDECYGLGAIECRLTNSFHRGKISVQDYTNDGLLLISNGGSLSKIADVLNIPIDAVVDISCASRDVSHIIMLDKVE